MWSADILGKSQRRIGSTNREERSEECASADAEKINAIQKSTGSQNLRNARNLGTPDESRNHHGGAIRM
jgi:hypothetical protein